MNVPALQDKGDAIAEGHGLVAAHFARGEGGWRKEKEEERKKRKPHGNGQVEVEGARGVTCHVLRL